ncbi:MAG TPA: DUF4139 domain-containing protein [Polyangiaceae bacterium]|nr:DUF4139 domain-containing protein [Polyangiaceae bacterium]
MKTKQSISGLAFFAALAAAGTQSALADAKPPVNPSATAHSVSGAEDRKAVSITVYNQNFGLVREVRELPALGNGKVELEFRDVAANIQPETVSIKAVGAGGGLSVLEQNYRYDLLTPQTLLEKNVGKRVRAYRYHESTGKEDAVDAELLSVEGGPVLKFNNEITFGYPARLAFPQVPDNLIAKPTLVWLVDSAAAKQTVEVTYLTQNLNWSADYVLVVDAAEKKGDLNGWVTLVNQSGASYKNAELKLVAGDVNRVRPQPVSEDYGYAMAKSAPAPAPQFQEQGLFEYHLYSLQRPTNVLQNEQKQVNLLSAAGIGVNKKLIFFGQQYWFRGQYGQVLSNQKVGVYLDIQNSEQNHLGMPLPKGTLRVYKADKSGAKQFVGEDTLDHTPRDEKLRVKMGDAFDVVGDRKQIEWRQLGNCSSESAWEIEIRNHKDSAVEVEDNEPAGGDWTIISSSQAAEKKDASSFTFTIKVPARGKTKVNYKVRVKWC